MRRDPGFLEDFLAGLPPRDREVASDGLAVLAGAAVLQDFAPGEMLLRQGAHGDDAWVIHAGRVEVFREGEAGALAVLEAGDVLGELSLTHGGARAASARALEPVRAWRIERRGFEQALLASPALTSLLGDKVYAQLARSFGRLQVQHRALQDAQANQRSLAFLFVAMMIVLSCYALGDGWLLTGLQVPAESPVRFWYSRIWEVSALVVCLTLARRTGMTFADMGVQWKGIGRSLAESAVITGCIMAWMYWARSRAVAAGAAPLSIVHFERLGWTNATYLLVAPMQEWLSRGMFQTGVERLLPFKGAGIAAVTVISLVFAMFHLHISVALSQAALATSILWGWMFLRHRNLAGISLSHFLLGTWADLLAGP